MREILTCHAMCHVNYVSLSHNQSTKLTKTIEITEFNNKNLIMSVLILSREYIKVERIFVFEFSSNLLLALCQPEFPF